MEFNKLKGFWKSSSTKHGATAHGQVDDNRIINSANANNNCNVAPNIIIGKAAELDSLDEIQPEITSEGYGLRTPYGTHLNLDFVKYCEDVATGQTFRRTASYRKPRSRTTSTAAMTQNNAARTRLAGGPSNESLDSVTYDGDASRTAAQAENTLMETRRRLEAFRSFRTKRNKSSEHGANHPPPVQHPNGYSTANYTARRGSTSPGSSSGSVTPNSLGSLLGGSQVTPQHLQIVREQMAAALMRLRELEEQVKTIPVLQVKISVLQQEKKHLQDELSKVEHSGTQQTANDSLINAVEENGNLDPDKSSPRSLGSVSSGVSSSHSSLASPRSASQSSTLSPPPQRSVSNEFPLRTLKGAPPVPPKRKYRSVGVGDPSPIWDVVCYSKQDRKFVDACVASDDIQRRDFGSLVEPNNIDAEFNIFPPPPKQYEERCTNTETFSSADANVQTVSHQGQSQSVQTECAQTASVGCGDRAFFEMVDRAMETTRLESSDASTMFQPCPVLTSHVETSTDDLQSFSDACVGDHVVMVTAAVATDTVPTTEAGTNCADLVRRNDASTETDARSTVSTGTTPIEWPTACAATSSDDLITNDDAASGPDVYQSFSDAATETEHKITENKAVDVSLPLADMTDAETITSRGKWCLYEDMRDASSGSDIGVEYKATGTNTAALRTLDQSIATDSVATESVAVAANIKSLSTDSCTNTPVVATADCATNCDVSTPVITSSSTNTPGVDTESRCTQCDAITERVTIDASTDTIDLDAISSTNEIDSYVDKVQSLLEEQQTLLAEKYEVFTDEWQKPDQSDSGKISRFVNPALNVQSDGKESAESSDEIRVDPISASFSLMRDSASGDYDQSEDDSDEDDDEEEYSVVARPTILPLPSAADLKPILKKPGTPVREKKFLRFAEGVKMGDSSSEEESSTDEEDSEESESEDDARKKKRAKRSVKVIRVYVRKPTPVEEKQWTYSDEFVKKPSSPVDVEPQAEVEAVVSAETLPPPEPVIEPTTDDHNITVCDGAETSNLEGSTAYKFTPELLDACDVLEKHLRNLKSVDRNDLMLATNLVQREWFDVAAREDSSRGLLDDFVTHLADTSLPVLRKVVNMSNSSGNTVLHYAVSHGNLEIVEMLLGIEELNVDRANQLGYTAAMLAALTEIKTAEETRIIKQLFEKSDINWHAKDFGQTALMLAVSQARMETAKLLIECGAEINAQDKDGSTALMCAAEHNHLEIVKLLLSQPSCDATIADTEGSTALSISIDRGRKEIAILLYTRLKFKPVSSHKFSRPREKCTSMIPGPARSPVKS